MDRRLVQPPSHQRRVPALFLDHRPHRSRQLLAPSQLVQHRRRLVELLPPREHVGQPQEVARLVRLDPTQRPLSIQCLLLLPQHPRDRSGVGEISGPVRTRPPKHGASLVSLRLRLDVRLPQRNLAQEPEPLLLERVQAHPIRSLEVPRVAIQLRDRLPVMRLRQPQHERPGGGVGPARRRPPKPRAHDRLQRRSLLQPIEHRRLLVQPQVVVRARGQGRGHALDQRAIEAQPRDRQPQHGVAKVTQERVRELVVHHVVRPRPLAQVHLLPPRG
ncbi:hypothetical protein ENSA7_32970 [Enhygromyxa salina]|uniref:Uncharacterized protein n=1 Tax=Enhygromyxa salina TaxID=215803 RepID=A0A2S9YPE7_9BACT|nr:hypothetical protein ENSA7_32970 [Enhygromyxa salina]